MHLMTVSVNVAHRRDDKIIEVKFPQETELEC